MLQLLETDALVPCPIQLRPVRKETLEFRELKRSIENLGVLNSILVRPVEGRMEVVDGSHRFAACRDLRLERIPAIVKELTDREVHLCQIQANASHVATSPVEYAR